LGLPLEERVRRGAPIVAARLVVIRTCRVNAMDETPIKAAHKGRGSLKTCPCSEQVSPI
jgi:hypothetical protein